MDDNMKPEKSPSHGVKKANNLPLYIAAGFGVIIVAAIIYGGFKRFEDGKRKKAEQGTHVEKPADSKTTIDNLLNSYEKTKKEIKPEEVKKEEKKPDTDTEKTRKQTPQEKLIEEIKRKKMDRLLVSISAKTSVNGGNWALNNESKDQSSSLEVSKKTTKTDWDLSSEVESPKSTYMLRAGHLIPSILKQRTISTLSGNVTALVTENIYDTATHKYLLIPQGTQIFGEYTGDVDFGQECLFIAWKRLTFPDGKVLDIAGMPSLGEEGGTGLQDTVDHHYFRIYGNALLMSAIVGATALSQAQNQANQVGGFNQNSISTLSQSLGQSLGQTSSKLIQKNINISPTVNIRPGLNFNIIATKDITFNSEFQSFDY